MGWKPLDELLCHISDNARIMEIVGNINLELNEQNYEKNHGTSTHDHLRK